MAFHTETEQDFEVRWAAWLARGAAHDREVQQRLVVAAGAAIVLAVIMAGWFGI
jgi:hypothetical protein